MEDLGTVTTTSNGTFVKVKYTLLSVNDNELSKNKKKNANMYEDVADRIIKMPVELEHYTMQVDAMNYEIMGLENALNKEKDKVAQRDKIIDKRDVDMARMHKSMRSFILWFLIAEAVCAALFVVILFLNK